jgi:cell division protein FtsA
LPDETIIDDQILQKLREQVDHNPIDGSLEVVDAVPCDFMVNNNETKSPKGTIGSYISGTYDLIVCRPQLKRNLQMTVSDKSGLKIEGFIVTALATGQLVLSGEQKRLGCMLADIGAETTSVSIYKDGNLRYYATIPIGSRNITRDITSLSVLEERAEEIKITSGDAIASTPASDLNIGGVRMSDVSNIVVARSEEIVANIIAQIEYSGLKNEDLPSGIVVIGGGSKLKGMIDLLKKQSYMNVERGELPAYVSIGEAKIPTSEIIEVVSVLYAGANTTNANCMQTPKGSELPVNGVADTEIETPQAAKAQNQQKEVKTQKWTKWRDRLSKIFTPQDDEEDTELE